MDPPRAEWRAAEHLLREQKYGDARRAFDALLVKYPESSDLLVSRGDADLNDEDKDYVGSADRALAFYARSRALDAQGCRLSRSGAYYVALHSAFAYLRKDDATQALRELSLLERDFADSAEVQYNLARAECLRNAPDKCFEHFERTLELAHARTRPKFLRTHYSLADWIRRSETQSEFGPLRSQPRYGELVRRMAQGS